MRDAVVAGKAWQSEGISSSMWRLDARVSVRVGHQSRRPGSRIIPGRRQVGSADRPAGVFFRATYADRDLHEYCHYLAASIALNS